MEVPSIASAVSPYIEFEDEHNGVFVDNDPRLWITAIEMLIEDSILRAKLASGARNTVEKLFNINDHYGLWLEVYKELSERRAAA